MTTILSLAFWSYFGLSLPFFFVLAILTRVLTYPLDRDGHCLHLFTSFWAAQYTYVNPMWTVVVEGRARGRVDGACVYVANHQSIADIVVLFCTYLPFKWISKASMFRVPFLGWNMRLNGYVPVVRGDRESGRAAQARALYWLERDVPMMYFPEGTRSLDGEIQPFRPGAFEAALMAGCPIVPIVLDGTHACVPKNSWRLQERARIRIRVLDPIAPPAASSPQTWADEVRRTMKSELRRLQAEGRPL